MLDMLANMSTTIYSYPVSGFAIAHLPSHATLWGALSLEAWVADATESSKKHTVYGLSDAGTLVRMQDEGAGFGIEMAEWDEWNAEVGNFGPLVMIIGSLLQTSI